MTKVTVVFRDGTLQTFSNDSKEGEYISTLKVSGSFIVIKQGYNKEIYFPESSIKRVEVIKE